MEHYDQADEHKAARQDSGRTTNRSLLGIICKKSKIIVSSIIQRRVNAFIYFTYF